MNASDRYLIYCSWKRIVFLLLSMVLASICSLASCHETPELRWVNDEWKISEKPFEMDWRTLVKRLSQPESHNDTYYVDRFKAEYPGFAHMKTDPQRLYRVSLAFMGASYTNYAFRKEHRNSKERWAIIQAWRQMPSQRCYEFSRLGFVFLSFYDRSAGTTAMGMYDSTVENLGIRLHQKEPGCPYIMIGYIQLCYNRGDTPNMCRLQCKQFGDQLIKLKKVTPGFWMSRSVAYFIYSRAKGVDEWEQRKIAKQAAEKYMKLRSHDPDARTTAESWIKRLQLGLDKPL